MIEYIREFTIREEARGRFELAFGRGGAWGRLFDQCAGFRGGTLLRDADQPRRYLLVAVWDSAAARDDALAQRADAHAALEADFAQWAEASRELGAFRLLAQTAVRPRSRR